MGHYLKITRRQKNYKLIKKIGRGRRGGRVKIILGVNFFAWARKGRKKLLGAEGAEGA